MTRRSRRARGGASTAFARRPPQLWCLCYLDTARHICGDAIEPKAVRLIAAVGDYVVSAEPRPKILRAQRYGSKSCDLSRPSVYLADVLAAWRVALFFVKCASALQLARLIIEERKSQSSQEAAPRLPKAEHS